MKQLADKIMSLMSSEKKITLGGEIVPLDFVRTRKGILRELALSQMSGNLIGFYAESLGKGMFLAEVEDILMDGRDEIIEFKYCEVSGHIPARNKLFLSEIKIVCPFAKTVRKSA